MKNRHWSRLAPVLLLGVLLAAPAHGAPGQGQPADGQALAAAAGNATAADGAPGAAPAVTLDKIVVSATRTEQSAFEAPASVVALEGDAIERCQATTLRDLLEDVPNLEFSDPTNPFIQKPSLRGLSPSQTIFKLDGARQNYTSQSGIGNSPVVIDPDMLKQVEVLRGPSSVLHGGGGIGGVISMRTKDAADLLEPGSNLGGKLKTGYLSGTHQTMSSLALYGRQGMFDLVGQGVYRDFGDTRTTNPSPSKDTSYRSGYSRSSLLKLAVTPDDDQYLSLAYTFSDGRHSSTRAVSTFTQQEHRLVGNYELAPADKPWLDLKLTTQAAWRENEYLNDVPRQLKDKFTSFGGSLQNTSRFSLGEVADNALTYGLDYYRDHQEGTDFGRPDPARPEATASDMGFFIQDELELFDRLTLIPALRYTSYSRSSDSDVADDQSEGRITPKFTTKLQVMPWLSVFGSYSESFRPPSMDEIYYAMDYPLPWGTIRVLPNPNLEPETAETWETGFNLGFDGVFTANDPLRLKATYFREDIKNLIESQLTKNFTTPPLGEIHYQSVNVNRAERFGYEVELEYGVAGFSFAASYGKTIGHDKETRERVGGSPEKLALRLGYLFADSGLNLFWKSRFVSAYRYYDVFAASEATRHPYAVHGVGLTWEPRLESLEGLRLDFSVDNLFDQHYTNYDGSYEIGQSVNMTLSYSF